MGWSGWSSSALDTAIIASPANRSISLPSCSTTFGMAPSQCPFTISITSSAGRPSEKLVNPCRSAKSTVTSFSLAAEPARIRLLRPGGPPAGADVTTEQRVDPRELPGASFQHRDLVGAETLFRKPLEQRCERLVLADRGTS